MARIQILELPEGAADERPPFALVIDQFEPQRYKLGSEVDTEYASLWESVGQRLGARAVLVFEETVEIPANEVPVTADGHPLRLHVEGDFTRFREQVEEHVLYAQGRLTRPLSP